MNINRVLGYLAVASAVIAFLLWALPFCSYPAAPAGVVCGDLWFSIHSDYLGMWSGEAQWVLVFAVASVVLLIARAGNRR